MYFRAFLSTFVVLLCTLGRVVLPNGTAHRPDGRLLLHHLPERFAVRDALYCNVNIVFLIEEQVPVVTFSPHHSPVGIMVGFAEW